MTPRVERLLPWLAPVVIVAVMWLAAALGYLVTGQQDTQTTGEVHRGEAVPSPAASSAPHVRSFQRTPAPKASRSRRDLPKKVTIRPASGSLNWHALRDCESSNNYSDRDSTLYRGAYQFDRGTWASVGGHGDPAAASPAEQDMRALRLYQQRGRSPWPVCGRRL